MCGSFGLTAAEAKTETICQITKRVDRVVFDTEAAGQVYKAPGLCTLGSLCENVDHTAEINRGVLLTNRRFRPYSLPLHDQATAPLRFKVRMLKAEVMETMGGVADQPAFQTV